MAALNYCIFRKISGCRSSAGPEILAFVSLATFHPVLDRFIRNFKLKYEDSENIKADCINTVVVNLHQIKRRAFFGTPGIICRLYSRKFVKKLQTNK